MRTGHHLVVLDDMQNATQGKFKGELERLFTVDSHHNNITVIFIVHDTYKKNMISLRRNMDYLLYMIGGNVQSQVMTTAQQMFLDGHEAVKMAIADIKNSKNMAICL